MLHTVELIMPVENGLPKKTCKSLIEKFDQSQDLLVDRVSDNYKFKELNLSQTPGFEGECNAIQSTANYMLTFYKKELKVKYFPDSFVLEEFRMKRYDPNGEDQFDWHVDVGSYDSAKRFMVVMFYLNTVEEGGQTIFNWEENDEDCAMVEAVEGTGLMFPPLWTHPHKGVKPISGPKYIVSTYAHYL